MELALLGALVMGITLGLLGSGGSILTIPILVVLLQRPEKEAVTESLAIVGCIALLGTLFYIKQKQIHWKSVLFFGLPGMLGTCLGGCGSYYVSGSIQIMIFTLVMLVVACMMLFGPLSFGQMRLSPQQSGVIIVEGFLIGCLVGFIGIGGGFLIVPSLVILRNLSMPIAIGTSLMIITMSSFVGFFEQLVILHALHLHVDWKIIGMMSIIGICGSLMGTLIGKRLSQAVLRKFFGINILLIGLYMFIERI